jgi:hypothetical protein
LSAQALCYAFVETLEWKTAPAAGNKYPTITAAVTLKIERQKDVDDETCANESDSIKIPVYIKPGSRVFSETYRWDSGKKRYVGKGKGFEELDKFNEKEF